MNQKIISPLILACLFFWVTNAAHARVGSPSCADLKVQAVSSQFNDLSQGALHFEGFSDYYYTLQAKILDVHLRKTDPNLGGSTCDNFTEEFQVGKIHRFTIEVGDTERLRILPGQYLLLNVASSGYAGIAENGILTPWHTWLLWTLLLTFIISAIWLLMIKLRETRVKHMVAKMKQKT